MKLYRIKDWDRLYENNRTRELKKLDWIPIPNKQDGEGYTLTVAQEDGAALLGAWLTILQTASKCGKRGTLMRDTGKAHDSASISRLTRLSQDLIERALKWFSSEEMQWILVSNIQEDAKHNGNNPHDDAVIPHEDAVIPQEGDLEGKGREGNRINPLTPLMLRIGGWFGRRPSTKWDDREIKNLKKQIPIEEDDLALLEKYYTAKIKKAEDYRRRNIPVLLNNFQGEVDRARKWKHEIEDPFKKGNGT